MTRLFKNLIRHVFSGKMFSIFLLLSLLFLSACSSTSEPEIEELVTPGVPTFQGARDRTYLSPSPSYLLEGECDPTSYGLQFMYNSTNNWIDLPGGCPINGRFSMTVPVNPRRHVYVRARSKYGFTEYSHALVKIILPPTAPSFMMVVSGYADEIGDFGHAGTMSYSWTGLTMDNGVHKMHQNVIGLVYEQY